MKVVETNTKGIIRQLGRSTSSSTDGLTNQDVLPERTRLGGASSVGPVEVVALQKTIGNRSVVRLLTIGSQHSATRKHDDDSATPRAGTAPSVQRSVVRPSAGRVGSSQTARYRELVKQYQALLRENALLPEEIAEADRTIRQAESDVREADRIAGRGQTLYSGAAVALGATAALGADDVTGIGIADNVAIPFTLLAAGILGAAGWFASSSTRDVQRAAYAARISVAEAIRTIGHIVFAQKVGKQVHGLTTELAIHLARFLGTAVGGQPPDHQRDPDRDRPHWWDEIKNRLQQIRNKGLSPKQLLRELRKRFSEQQLSEIREALRRVAEKMGAEPPDFPPTAAP